MGIVRTVQQKGGISALSLDVLQTSGDKGFRQPFTDSFFIRFPAFPVADEQPCRKRRFCINPLMRAVQTERRRIGQRKQGGQ